MKHHKPISMAKPKLTPWLLLLLAALVFFTVALLYGKKLAKPQQDPLEAQIDAIQKQADDNQKEVLKELKAANQIQQDLDGVKVELAVEQREINELKSLAEKPENSSTDGRTKHVTNRCGVTMPVMRDSRNQARLVLYNFGQGVGQWNLRDWDRGDIK